MVSVAGKIGGGGWTNDRRIRKFPTLFDSPTTYELVNFVGLIAQLGSFHTLEDRTHYPAHYASLHGVFRRFMR